MNPFSSLFIHFLKKFTFFAFVIAMISANIIQPFLFRSTARNRVGKSEGHITLEVSSLNILATE